MLKITIFKIYRCYYFLLFVFSNSPLLISAQSVQVVANPNTNFGGILYSGNNHPVIFNNKLMIEYSTFLLYTQLAEYDGDSIKLIPNPDLSDAPSFNSPVVYNNNFYTTYFSQNKLYQLVKYDGNSQTLIAPLANGDRYDTGLEYYFTPSAYNNKLYFPYHFHTHSIMTVYNGSNLAIDSAAGEVYSSVVPLNNKLAYIGNGHIVTYNGSLLQSFVNPTTNGWIASPIAPPQIDKPVVFNNKMYYAYHEDLLNSNTSLASFDGNTVKIEQNTSLPGGVVYYPFATSSMLYFQVQGEDGKLHLAGFNGTSLSVSSNPDSAGQFLVGDAKNFQVSFNNSLYILYTFASGIQNLVKYDGSQLTVIPNPDGGNGFYGSLYVYDNKIYSAYVTKDNGKKIVSYDGSNFNFISSPAFYGGFNSPIEYNNRLYFVMGNGIQNSLCYLATTVTSISNIKPGNWSDPTTWSNNKIPDANTVVLLNFDIVVDINAECKTLTANGHTVIVNSSVNLQIGP